MKGAAIALAVVVALSSAGVIALMDDDRTADESSAAWSFTGFHIDVPGWVHGAAEFLGYSHGEPDVPAGDDTAVKAAMRLTAMTYTAADTEIWAGSSAVLVDNNAQTLQFVKSYADRAAEIAAGSDWTSGATYDPEAVLADAGILRMIGSSQYNTDYGLYYGISQMADRASDQWAGKEAYGDIRQEIAWSGGSTGLTHGSVMLYFTSIVDASVGHARVWYGDDGTGAWHEPIWAFADGCTMTADDGTVYNLVKGANTPSMKAGWYTLSTGIYAGSFQPSPDTEHSASVSGGAAIVSGSDCGYASVGSGGAITVRWGDMSYRTEYIRYHYSDGSQNASTDSLAQDALANLLSKYHAQTAAYAEIISSASAAGQVMWMLSSAAQSSNILLSPSSNSTRLSGMGIDVNQSYAVAVSALSQTSDWYSTYGSQLTAAETRISSESLKLYCFGDVYDQNGDVLYSNVVFTPYTYNTTINIYGDGKPTAWPMDGIAMVWTAPGDVADIGQFNASEPASHAVVVMPKGSSMVCKQIMYGHSLVSSVTLHATEIQKSAELASVFLDDVEPPKVLSAETLVMIIVLEAAAIIAVIGLWTRQPALIVIALGIAACAILFKSAIAHWMLGRFGS
jgi:hypothetical protein